MAARNVDYRTLLGWSSMVRSSSLNADQITLAPVIECHARFPSGNSEQLQCTFDVGLDLPPICRHSARVIRPKPTCLEIRTAPDKRAEAHRQGEEFGSAPALPIERFGRIEQFPCFSASQLAFLVFPSGTDLKASYAVGAAAGNDWSVKA